MKICRFCMLGAFVLLTTASCKRRIEYSANQGRICMNTPSASIDEATGEPQTWQLSLDVVYDECASGCASVESRCEMELRGSSVFFYPSAEVTFKRRGDCPTVCVLVHAHCLYPEAFARGDYSVFVGDRPVNVQVPSPRVKCGAVFPSVTSSDSATYTWSGDSDSGTTSTQ